MDDLTAFKTQIIKYSLILTVIFEAGSIPLLGFSVEYLCGLLAGTLTSVSGFIMLVATSKKVVASGEKSIAVLGYLLRLLIFGAVFFIALKLGGAIAMIACFLGFMTTKVSIFYVHGVKAKFSKDREVRPEVLAEYEREDREEEEDTWKD